MACIYSTTYRSDSVLDSYTQATQSGTRQTRRQRFNFELSDGSDYNPFGRSGGGAPLKTGSGKLQASVKADPDIRFQDRLKKEVNDSLVS